MDVLLGAEIFYELLRPGQIYCGDSRLLLEEKVFGYVVSGSAEIWQRKMDWDEELLPDIREKFEQWCSEASFLCELQIPRYALECDSVKQGFVALLSWKNNPSDLLTRSISADSLINCEKWWKGPSFLQEGNTVPLSNNVLLSDESAYLEELKPSERKTLTV
ncbi:hypothetical protein TNCV_4372751 [Trichonephila clavipes]|nr:hypothetical protein TNCV_4372751 [Trichonephila clavipes]